MYSSGGAYGVVREEGTSWIANNISQINLSHQWSGGCYSQINLTSELMGEVYEKEIPLPTLVEKPYKDYAD